MLTPTASWVSKRQPDQRPVRMLGPQVPVTGRVRLGRHVAGQARSASSTSSASTLGSCGASPADGSARHAATSTFSTVMAWVGQASTQAGSNPSARRGWHMSHLVHDATVRLEHRHRVRAVPRAVLAADAVVGVVGDDAVGSFTYALVGQPSRHAGSRQWLHDIDRWKRRVSGWSPPSISPTRRHVVPGGSPFCSAHATSQEWHPMQASMEKPNRYCSPASSGSSSGPCPGPIPRCVGRESGRVWAAAPRARRGPPCQAAIGHRSASRTTRIPSTTCTSCTATSRQRRGTGPSPARSDACTSAKPRWRPRSTSPTMPRLSTLAPEHGSTLSIACKLPSASRNTATARPSTSAATPRSGISRSSEHTLIHRRVK